MSPVLPTLWSTGYCLYLGCNHVIYTDPDDASDFKLDKFLAAPCETFDPHYGNLQ